MEQGLSIDQRYPIDTFDEFAAHALRRGVLVVGMVRKFRPEDEWHAIDGDEDFAIVRTTNPNVRSDGGFINYANGLPGALELYEGDVVGFGSTNAISSKGVHSMHAITTDRFDDGHLRVRLVDWEEVAGRDMKFSYDFDGNMVPTPEQVFMLEQTERARLGALDNVLATVAPFRES